MNVGDREDQHRTVFCAFVTWMGWHYPAGPAGRHLSPSRPAGRNRPRGPVLLYTVRSDLDGHGAHDVTGGRSPLVLAGPLRAVRGRAARAGTRRRRVAGA